MNAAQFVLALLDAYGGRIHGRTLFQKTGYFASLLSGLDPGLEYDAHYYGPYSTVVDTSVARLKNLGFIGEESTGFGIYNEGFELRRFDYKITSDGEKLLSTLRAIPEYKKIASAVNRIKAAGDPGYFELSIAAKAYFILNKRNKPMSNSEIRSEAEKFNWNIPEQSLEKAVRFLQQMDLTEDSQRPKAV